MAPNTKSANAIKHADEYLKVGEKAAAVQCLYDALESNKNKTWCAATQDAVDKLLSICIDLRDSDSAKEALSQYRNICQTIAADSMTTVVNTFLDACMEKITEAETKYELKDGFHVDLEEDISAESILYSVSLKEDDKQRIEHEVIYPLMKFYWDNLRNILDLVKVNNTMEALYHSVCEKAFDFCLQYNRTSEFRTLRRSLHKHLENLMAPAQDQASMKFRVVWSPKTAEMQLNTRFVQLDTAFKLKLWSEAFNTMSDIRVIMALNSCKSSMMATYYEKLVQLFWISNNYFYHAYARLRLLSLHKRQNKLLTEEELRCMAAQALLASICIPTYSVTEDESHPQFKIEREKEQSIIRLLNLTSHNTRASLHAELHSLEVLSQVPEELRTLYTILEMEFHPLDLVDRVKDILIWVNSHEEYKQYIPQLRRLVLLRVLTQMESVYSVMKMDSYNLLLKDLQFDRHEAERIIVEAGSCNQLHIRLDYVSQCVYFKQNVTERDLVSSYLSTLSRNLTSVMVSVNPENTLMELREEEMLDLMDRAHDTKNLINQAMIERFADINKLKLEEEERERNKNMSEADRLKKESVEREQREQQRLREEELRRAKESVERDRRASEEMEKANILGKLRTLLGRRMETEFVNGMTLPEMRGYTAIVQQKAEKERLEKMEKESEKQIFYARAVREAALPSMQQYFVTKREEAIAYWNGCFDTLYDQKMAVLDRDKAMRPVCDRVTPFLDEFCKRVLGRRAEAVSEEVEKRFEAAEARKREEEARKREEEERIAAERLEKKRAAEKKRKEEEERRKKEEEEERKRQEESNRKRKEAERLAAEILEKLNSLAESSSEEEEKPKRRIPRRAPSNATSIPSVAVPAPAVSTPESESSMSPMTSKYEDEEWKEITLKRKSRKAPPKK